MTSWAPIPFILSYRPSPRRSRSPSIWRAGNLLGIARTLQPIVLGGVDSGRTAYTSGGVLSSFPGQNGQNPVLLGTGTAVKLVGRRLRSVAMITQRPITGSLRSSGNAPPRGPEAGGRPASGPSLDRRGGV